MVPVDATGAALTYGTPTRWPQVRFDRSGDDTCGHDNDN
jgi:hypothetical protein